MAITLYTHSRFPEPTPDDLRQAALFLLEGIRVPDRYLPGLAKLALRQIEEESS